jgi:hypothetical protein
MGEEGKRKKDELRRKKEEVRAPTHMIVLVLELVLRPRLLKITAENGC